MRVSKYLYILESVEGKSIIFNAISRRFLLIPRENTKDFVGMIRPAAEKNKPTPFFSKLVEAQFLIDDGANELEQVRQNWQRNRNNDVYHTLIIPTYNCNFS